MQFNFVPPALIFYTGWGLSDGVAGASNGPVVRIRPNLVSDRGLLMHELEHVRQWWITLGLGPLAYLVSRHYRRWSESRAYRVQMNYPREDGTFMTVGAAALRLTSERYKLGLTYERALEIMSAL